MVCWFVVDWFGFAGGFVVIDSLVWLIVAFAYWWLLYVNSVVQFYSFCYF